MLLFLFLNYWFKRFILFSLIAELVILLGIPSKEIKAEIEIYPETAETKIRSLQYNLESYKPFCASYSSIHFAL